MGVGRGVPKNWVTLGPAPWDGDVADPLKHVTLPFVIPYSYAVAERLGWWIRDQQVAGSNPGHRTVECNTRQVV